MDLIKAKRLAEDAGTPDLLSHHQSMHADAKVKMIKATNAKIHLNDDGSPNPEGEKEIQSYADAMKFHQTEAQKILSGNNDAEAQAAQIQNQTAQQQGDAQAQMTLAQANMTATMATHAKDPAFAKLLATKGNLAGLNNSPESQMPQQPQQQQEGVSMKLSAAKNIAKNLSEASSEFKIQHFNNGVPTSFGSKRVYYPHGSKVKIPDRYNGEKWNGEKYSGPSEGVVVGATDSEDHYRVKLTLPKGHPEAFDDNGDPEHTKHILAHHEELTKHNPEYLKK